jgi:IS605 OrfB family transposase
MLVGKTIKCKIFQPTKLKYDILKQEYDNLQRFLRGENTELYSANKQQAIRFYHKIIGKAVREYPLSIRKDLIKVKETGHKLAKYWIRIPVKSRRGGLWLAIKPHEPIDFSCEFCESKILKKKNDFFVYLVVQKEVKIKQKYSSIIAIDIGERMTATVLLDSKPRFYGREIRGIRRKYAYIRRRLGEKKLLKKIKQIGQKEHQIVNQKLHEISKRIVSLAYQHNSLILLGDLKGIRKSARGKRFNRIVSNMPYYKLTKYIEYKAIWKGIKVIKINERGTSHICPKCKSEGKRPYQGLFICKSCGYTANADFVGAQNIKKRFEEYISSNGADVTQLETLRR